MKTTLLRLFIAGVLGAFAWLSWSESRLAARVADAKQDVATFNHQDLDALTPERAVSDYLPGDRRRLSDEIRIVKARVAYWLGRYGAVAADTDSSEADADILLAAANAAFREAQRDPATGPAAVQKLDGVLQAYASALKAAPRNGNAAYNYEFVARIRDQVARSQGKAAKIGPVTPGNADVRRRPAAWRDDSRHARRTAARREDGRAADDRANGIRRSRSAAPGNARSPARAQGVSAILLREGFVGQVDFAAPQLLWLLAAPALLLLAWVWRFWRRLADLRRLRAQRSVPIRERFALGGDLWAWFFLILSAAAFAIALARPRGITTVVNRAGIDIVILQDGSASMHVTDVPSTRWSRSMDFLRLLGDSLSWTNDRMALTVFAHIATPQIRLTKDPNTVFFFLDHLHDRPPFRLEDDTTWDTNLEQGIAWGLRLLEKDRELHGPSPNGKLFVLLSDGESWSGEVARSIERAVREHVPLHVIGVGTLAGGDLPVTTIDGVEEPSPGRSRLDRASLQRIASAGGRPVLRAGSRSRSRYRQRDHRRRPASVGDDDGNRHGGRAVLAVPCSRTSSRGHG